MNLAVFDIDGTLTLGDGLGTRCFFSTFDGMFGSGRADRRLESYAESTDAGIALEAARRALGREPGTGELDRFKSAYLARLEREISCREGAYRPVPGAEHVLALVASRPGWTVAIATGNWRRAASLKLDCARIAPPPVAACAEDGLSRRAVLAAAIRSASKAQGAPAFERVVYVGDQPWDLRAARELGVAFVGVGTSGRADRLEEHGARVVHGYEDRQRFLDELDAAAADPAATPVRP